MAQLGTTNISTTLVGTTLGTSVRAVAQLCTHVNVNRWSKYKPIEFNKNGGLTYNDYVNASFGINISKITNIKSNTNWEYVKPNSYGKRLGDFRNYYHDAPIPFLQKQGTSKTINRFSGGSNNIVFDILQAPTGYSDYVLNVSNLAPVGGDNVLLDNYYLACAIYNSSNVLVGIYYSYSKIKYSSGIGSDMNGASIVLTSGSTFNSNDTPIEEYQPGNYTMYLYICNQDKGTYINPRKYWPIYHTTTYPNSISLNILSLSNIVEITTLGIRPTGGSWVDNDDSFLVGDISAYTRGTFYDFHAKFTFTNLTGSTIYIPANKPFLFYNYITAWGGTVSRRYSALNYGSNDIIIAPYATVSDIIFNITPLPNTMSDANGSLTLNLHLHYGNNDSGEYFEPTPDTITLYYVE